jgi:hypothetical protein
VLLRRPELLYRLDRLLQEITGGRIRLTTESFSDTDHRILFQILHQSLEQDGEDPEHYLSSQIPESLNVLVKELLAKSGTAEPLDDRAVEDLARSVLNLARRAQDDQISQLHFLIEDNQEQVKMMVANERQLALEHARMRQVLDQAVRKLNGPRE